jgi:adenosylmethionine-8-amino-7-oxononanoate aminotransferase
MAPSRFLHPFASPAKDDFLRIVRGDGATVYDDRGNAYVDAMASLWYANVGHGRADMAEAIARQARRLENYNTFDPFTNEPAETLAEMIAVRSPHPDGRVFFTSSGSEAVDSAIKLARLYFHLLGQPERYRVISRGQGYHGVTYGGVSAQGLPPNRVGWGPLLDGFHQVGQHDIEAVRALFAEHGGAIAAVITEPVQGAGGVFPPEPGYLEELRRLCDLHGALLLFDEVVCGFGRLGTWFGAQDFGVRPDMLTFAKGVTSGYLPLGGVVLSRAVCEALEADPQFILRHGFTYSGHPTCCAAGRASIEIIEGEGLLERGQAMGRRLHEGLAALQRDGTVADVRGRGAVWAVSMPEGRDATAVRDEMLRRGVIARPIGQALAFCPPFVTRDVQIDRCIEALRGALE